MTVAVGSRVDGKDDGIGAGILAALDDLLGLGVVGGEVQLFLLALVSSLRDQVTCLLEHNLALGLSSVDLLNGEVGVVGGLHRCQLVTETLGLRNIGSHNVNDVAGGGTLDEVILGQGMSILCTSARANVERSRDVVAKHGSPTDTDQPHISAKATPMRQVINIRQRALDVGNVHQHARLEAVAVVHLEVVAV